jgi:hypothetical protein
MVSHPSLQYFDSSLDLCIILVDAICIASTSKEIPCLIMYGDVTPF